MIFSLFVKPPNLSWKGWALPPHCEFFYTSVKMGMLRKAYSNRSEPGPVLCGAQDAARVLKPDH